MLLRRSFPLPALASLALACAALPAQIVDYPDDEVAGIPVNYTEARVGHYRLPDLLRLENGEPVRDARTWLDKRRPEIVELFEQNQYGRAPAPRNIRYDVFEDFGVALGGKAVRRQVTIYFSKDPKGPQMDLLLYVPANAGGPVPVLLNVSFTANSNTVDDPHVKEGTIWNRDKQRVPASQGRRFGRLPVEAFIDKGFGIATVYYGDIEPDFDGGLPYGVRNLYLRDGQEKPAPDEWGAIAAWAWGLSRALDYFETDEDVDASRVTLMGVSRLGKTVLWAGARDSRFAAVIASCSGEGGAALARRNYGERLQHLAARYGYQARGELRPVRGRCERLSGRRPHAGRPNGPPSRAAADRRLGQVVRSTRRVRGGRRRGSRLRTPRQTVARDRPDPPAERADPARPVVPDAPRRARNRPGGLGRLPALHPAAFRPSALAAPPLPRSDERNRPQFFLFPSFF